jgi:hypothetical protein
MSVNLRTWEASFKKAVDKPEEFYRNFVQAVALQALSDLVYGTRVRDGRARANWQVTVGRPADGFQEIFDKVGAQTLDKGTPVIREADGKDVIWIHNGVEYISFLERKDKMLAGAVEAARTRIRSLKK